MPNGIFTLTQVNQAVRQGAWTGFIAPTWVEYLVVAGGGGGAYTGGGGAGGLLTGVVTVLAGTSYTVTIGPGGAGSTGGGDNATQGTASSFGSISATGGGAGILNYTASAAKNNGGSGGGGGLSTIANGQGTSGQGNAGGLSSASNGGGGGGAGTVGLVATTYGGNGGAGIASAITGSVVTYGGGGGGGFANSINSNPGLGGVGGGGNAGVSSGGVGGSGGGNTGGGGGASVYVGPTYYAGGNGGSGVVIIRYPGTVQYFTGGTLSYANGYVIHTFNASGTLAPTTPTPYVANDYQISRSLRFNSADGAYLNRTPASAGNRKTWTWSGWVKRSALSTNSYLFGNLDGSGLNGFGFQCIAGNTFDIFDYSSSAFVWRLTTTQVFRDPSAWYHFVLAFDSTQATSANRVRFYVNGVEVTAFTTATYPIQNYDGYWNNTSASSIGRTGAFNGQYFNGYITETNFIDGQALTPSSFGYYDFNTGVWSPTRYVGVYGTNGFYLNFSDNSNTTAATLGRDYSGNSNNWTPNNFSVSAGVNNDSLVDVPTNWGTDTGVGGSVRGNYCTFNPLIARWDVNTGALSNGNLEAFDTVGDANNPYFFGTLSVSSGKFYWEITVTAIGTSAAGFFIGVDSGRTQSVNLVDWVAYAGDGQKYVGGPASSYGATYTTGDVIGVALDKDANTVTFYKNNASQGAISLPTNVPMVAWLSPGANSGYATANFGQRPFAYTAPSGFKALNTQNLPTPTIGATTATQAGKFFNPVLWTANGGVQTITGAGLQPDFLWIKDRQAANSHTLHNIVVGSTKYLESNTTSAEITSANYVTSIDSDGWSIGTSNYLSGRQLVSWCWKANGAGVTNTAGSITSTVSANTTSGFSVVTYTGTGSNATVGHGLGAAPRMIIIKNRSSALGWPVYHASLGTNGRKFLFLNTTDSVADDSIWNSTNPTSTVFSLGAVGGSLAGWANGSGNNLVAYCFAEVPGYSNFGSYTGNGSADGIFVFTGFRPAYVMIKNASLASAWIVYDNKRNTANVETNYLLPNSSGAEATLSSLVLDFTSNGFKIRGDQATINTAANNYIFAAFAEAPQKFALAR